MPKKRSVCPHYNKKLQRMSKRLKVPQSPVVMPETAPVDLDPFKKIGEILDAQPVPEGDRYLMMPESQLPEWAKEQLRQQDAEAVKPHVDEYALPIPDGEYKMPDGGTVTLGPSALFSLDDLLPKD